MKTNIFTLFFILYTAAAITAQTDTSANMQPTKSWAEPYDHPKEVYVEEETNNLYWPQDKSFWVRLATSPRKDAPSFLLKKVDSKSLASSEEYNKEGIKLELSGNQFIRWYHYIKKDTLRLKFFSDGDPPSLSIEFSGAPKYEPGNNVFYGVGLTTTIFAEDELSGVNALYTSVNGAKFQLYQEPVHFPKENEYSFRYYGVDNNGNQSEVNESNFIVDLTPPASKHEIMTNFSGNVLSPESVVKLTSSDDLSGTNLFYNFDNGDDLQIESGKEVPVKPLADGNHNLNYYAVDNVENRSTTKEYSFYLDKTPPTAEYSIIGDQHTKNNVIYVSQRTTVSFSAQDNKIGVDRIEYSLNQGNFSGFSSPFYVPDGVKKTSIRFKGIDKLKNTSKDFTLNVEMDKTPPKTGHSFDGPNYTQRGITWITSDTKISLTAQDEQSGVKKIHYQFDINPTETFDTPITLPNEGAYTFKYWSIDNVNNTENSKTYKLDVDNTPPEITSVFSVNSIENRVVEGTSLEVYPRNCSIFLTASDNSASTEGIRYTLNGGQQKEYAQPIEFNEPGNYSLKVTSKDMVGNTNEKTFEFIIGE